MPLCLGGIESVLCGETAEDRRNPEPFLGCVIEDDAFGVRLDDEWPVQLPGIREQGLHFCKERFLVKLAECWVITVTHEVGGDAPMPQTLALTAIVRVSIIPAPDEKVE